MSSNRSSVCDTKVTGRWLVAAVFAVLGLGGMAISSLSSPANFFAAANCFLLAILVGRQGTAGGQASSRE